MVVQRDMITCEKFKMHHLKSSKLIQTRFGKESLYQYVVQINIVQVYQNVQYSLNIFAV